MPTDRMVWARGLLALLAAYAAYWGYRFALAWLGALAPLVVGPAFAFLLVVAAAWLWRRIKGRLLDGVGAAAGWARVRLRRVGPFRALQGRFPGVWRFLGARVEPGTATGLGLSVAALAAVGALWAFLEILFEVVSGSDVTTVDRRVIHLMAMVRTPGVDRFMLAVTYAGSARSVAVLAGAAVVAALLLRRRRDAVLVLLSIVAASAFFGVTKVLVHRSRPPLYDARIVQAGFSFPSGHATMAVAFWGTIGLLVILALRAGWARVGVAALTAAVALLIGISRVYLGVHYPSDVIGGWVGGALWVALAYAAVRVWQSQGHGRRLRHGKELPGHSHLPRATAAALVVVAAATCVVLTRPTVPAPPRTPPEAALPVSPNSIEALVLGGVPHHTRSLLGHAQEPVNLVFVATRARLRSTFRAAEWTEAARVTAGSLWQAALATMAGRADSAGPVTPSFLGEDPETLAFSLPVGRDFSRRHHIRIWETRYETPDGRTVWLATASYDAGFAIVSSTLLPIHRIAPDIDSERDFIARDLAATGRVARADTIQLVPPEMGTNAFGSPFFTYGKALVLWLDGGAGSGPDSPVSEGP